MKLKEFNSETCANVRQNNSLPSVGINTKSGLFNFNAEAVKLIGLEDGESVIFLQDEEEPTDWYIEKAKEKGFVVRKKESVTRGLLFNNSALARQIAASVEFAGKSGRCLIAGEPTKLKNRLLFGVITGTLVNK